MGTIKYTALKIIGKGSYGLVIQAANVETGEILAIKKVYQNPKFMNRELSILKIVKNQCPSIVQLRDHFFTKAIDAQSDKPRIYLNLVFEYVPKDLGSLLLYHSVGHFPLPLVYVKLYSYQLFQALAFLRSRQICHRDISPQNLLVDHKKGILKLADFGSAKVIPLGNRNLEEGKRVESVAYMVPRYYRAPELIFGSKFYDQSIDTWSAGVILLQMLANKQIFRGETALDVLASIIRTLGNPTREDVISMNPDSVGFDFGNIPRKSWFEILGTLRKDWGSSREEAFDLLDKILVFNPGRRITPSEVLKHPFYDDIRGKKRILLPNGRECRLSECFF